MAVPHVHVHSVQPRFKPFFVSRGSKITHLRHLTKRKVYSPVHYFGKLLSLHCCARAESFAAGRNCDRYPSVYVVRCIYSRLFVSGSTTRIFGAERPIISIAMERIGVHVQNKRIRTGISIHRYDWGVSGLDISACRPVVGIPN